jgi:starch synthase (maltosyl-transferring)
MAKVKRGRTERTSGSESFDRLVIECVSPELDAGRYPVKRIVGDLCEIGADIFKDGHELLAGHVRYRVPGDNGWRFTALTYVPDDDRWYATLPLDRIGRWEFTVEAWTDLFGSWRSELGKKLAADQVVGSELLEGAALIRDAARRSKFGEGRKSLEAAATLLEDQSVEEGIRGQTALAPDLLELMEAHFVPRDLTDYGRILPITVDRERAGFAAWYEMFPRSQTTHPTRHGTFRDAERSLPRIAELGFDVIYLPPIHPIGNTFRKGPNNSLVAGPDDPGSPWAIGSELGGHDAIDPRLGTVEDFEHFVEAAEGLGLEIALDYALQCSPDHPWVKEHPEWFFIRPDGTIKYAENPPKKYQDIYPINFWCDDRAALWDACKEILEIWIDRGVRTFRVDNPHTKPFTFWEWMIGDIQRERPDIVFLAEAFTRPKKMRNLGKLGFTQSYTYFTWKNSSSEMIEYFTELTQSEMVEYYRGNLFANTPDILHEYLQHGGPPAFGVRLVLAATLLPIYGIYSGYELFENVPVKAKSEEYLDSEKYQIRVRDWSAKPNLDAEIRLLNRLRREHPSLQLYDNLRFHHSENPEILFYSKLDPNGIGPAPRDDLLIAVNLDPRRPHHTMVNVPLDLLGIPEHRPYQVEDLLTGARYTWQGPRNYVRLDPAFQVAHIFRVLR